MMKILKFIAFLMMIPSLCFGAGGSSLNFDGTDDVVVATSYKGITGTSPRSIIAWFKCNHSGSNGRLFQWGDSSGLNAGRSETFTVESGVFWGRHNSGVTWNTGSGFGDSTWHSFGATLQAGGLNNQRKVYLDFSLRSPTFANGTTAINTLSDIDVRMGLDHISTTDFNGQIAYAQIYNSELTATQIYESLWKPETVGDKQLFYPGWTSDLGTEQDISGNNRDGAITGGSGSGLGPPVMFGGGLPL